MVIFGMHLDALLFYSSILHSASNTLHCPLYHKADYYWLRFGKFERHAQKAYHAQHYFPHASIWTSIWLHIVHNVAAQSRLQEVVGARLVANIRWRDYVRE